MTQASPVLEKRLARFYITCKRCADELGYPDDAPKFATERGLKSHLKLVHHGAVDNERERFTL